MIFQFAKMYIKEPVEFWKKVLWTDEIHILLVSEWWKEYWGLKELPKIQIIPPPPYGGVMVSACVAATGTDSLVFIDYILYLLIAAVEIILRCTDTLYLLKFKLKTTKKGWS